MLRLGLVGKNIAHSKSPVVYKKILSEPFEYHLLDYASLEDIPSLKKIFESFDGINITAPYKKVFLHQLDINESAIDGINVVKFHNGKYIGTNTDYLACAEIFDDIITQQKISTIYVLGSGVMANLFLKLFHDKKIKFKNLARSLGNLDEINKVENSSLIINCCAREYNFKTNSESNFIFWDMNYKHEKNAQAVTLKKSQYIDGMGLLVLQAKYAVKFWNYK